MSREKLEYPRENARAWLGRDVGPVTRAAMALNDDLCLLELIPMLQLERKQIPAGH